MLVPLLDRIVVRVTEKDRTKGGILIPDKARGQGRRAVVVAVGPGLWKDGAFIPPLAVPTEIPGSGPFVAMAPGVKAGDTVVFGQWAGAEFQRHESEDEDGEVLILDERDILAVERKK